MADPLVDDPLVQPPPAAPPPPDPLTDLGSAVGATNRLSILKEPSHVADPLVDAPALPAQPAAPVQPTTLAAPPVTGLDDLTARVGRVTPATGQPIVEDPVRERPVTVKGYVGTWTRSQIEAVLNYEQAKTAQSYVSYANALGDHSMDGWDIPDAEVRRNPTAAQQRDMARTRLNFRAWLDRTGRADMFDKGTEKDIINEYANSLYGPIPNISGGRIAGFKQAPEAAMMADMLAGESRSLYYRPVPTAEEFADAADAQDQQRQQEDAINQLKRNDVAQPVDPNETAVDEHGNKVAVRPEFSDVVQVRVRGADGLWSMKDRREWDALNESASREAILQRASIVGDNSILGKGLGQAAEDRILYWQYITSQGYGTNLTSDEIKNTVNDFVIAQEGDESHPIFDRKGQDTGKVGESARAKEIRRNLTGVFTSRMNKYKVPSYDDIEDAIATAEERGSKSYMDQKAVYDAETKALKDAANPPTPEGPTRTVFGAIYDTGVYGASTLAGGVVSIADLVDKGLAIAGVSTGENLAVVNQGLADLSTWAHTDYENEHARKVDEAFQSTQMVPVAQAILRFDFAGAKEAAKHTDFAQLFETLTAADYARLVAQLGATLYSGGVIAKGAKAATVARMTGTAEKTAAELARIQKIGTRVGVGTAAATLAGGQTAATLSGVQQQIRNMDPQLLDRSSIGLEARASLVADGITDPTHEQIVEYAVENAGSLTNTEAMGIYAVNVLGNLYAGPGAAFRYFAGSAVRRGTGRLAGGVLAGSVGVGQTVAQGELSNNLREEAGLPRVDYGGDVAIAATTGVLLGMLEGGGKRPAPEPKPTPTPEATSTPGAASKAAEDVLQTDDINAAVREHRVDVATYKEANRKTVDAAIALQRAKQAMDDLTDAVANPEKYKDTYSIRNDEDAAQKLSTAVKTYVDAKKAYTDAYSEFVKMRDGMLGTQAAPLNEFEAQQLREAVSVDTEPYYGPDDEHGPAFYDQTYADLRAGNRDYLKEDPTYYGSAAARALGDIPVNIFGEPISAYAAGVEGTVTAPSDMIWDAPTSLQMGPRTFRSQTALPFARTDQRVLPYYRSEADIVVGPDGSASLRVPPVINVREGPSAFRELEYQPRPEPPRTDPLLQITDQTRRGAAPVTAAELAGYSGIDVARNGYVAPEAMVWDAPTEVAIARSVAGQHPGADTSNRLLNWSGDPTRQATIGRLAQASREAVAAMETAKRNAAEETARAAEAARRAAEEADMRWADDGGPVPGEAVPRKVATPPTPKAPPVRKGKAPAVEAPQPTPETAPAEAMAEVPATNNLARLLRNPKATEAEKIRAAEADITAFKLRKQKELLDAQEEVRSAERNVDAVGRSKVNAARGKVARIRDDITRVADTLTVDQWRKMQGDPAMRTLSPELKARQEAAQLKRDMEDATYRAFSEAKPPVVETVRKRAGPNAPRSLADEAGLGGKPKAPKPLSEAQVKALLNTRTKDKC